MAGNNLYKDSGLSGIQLARPDSSAGLFKESGLAGMQLARPESANPFKDSGLGNIQLERDEDGGRSGGSGTADSTQEQLNEIQFIVAKLNEELHETYTLVSFDQKKDRELLQVLNDILAALESSMSTDVTKEDPNACAGRMGDFLVSILNYRVAPDQAGRIQNALLTGEKNTTHSLIYWVLKRMPENRKRVYLAKFLMPLEIPEDLIASDDGVKDVHQHYIQAVETFKQVHKVVDKMKEGSDSGNLKAELQKAEQEKEQLAGRVEATKRRLEKVKNHGKILEAAKALRKESDDSKALRDRLIEHQSYQRSAEQRMALAHKRMAQLKEDFGEMDINKLIKGLQEEVTKNQTLVQTKIPREMSELQAKYDQLVNILQESLDPETLATQVAQLERDIKEIEDEATPKMDPKEEASLGLFRQQAALVSNRKEKHTTELDHFKEQRSKLAAVLQDKQGEFASHQGSKILKGDEFKQYANSLRGKSTNYKRLKTDLQNLQGELGVLQRTEELLLQRLQTLDETLSKLEAERGVRGYQKTQNQLVNVSAQKMEVDEAKGKTLEELSKIVQEFVTKIRDQRNKLAPQILELRNTRQKAQAVEQEYMQRKEIYDSNKQELDADISKLQQEVDQNTEDCRLHESLYHRVNCQITIAQVACNRVADEQAHKSGSKKLSERFKTYGEMFDHQVSQLERISKELRDRKKEIEENHDANLQQMAWFKNLKTLLECKLASYKREKAPEQLSGIDMSEPHAIVNRLVLV